MYYLLTLLGGALYALGFPNNFLPANALFPILGFSLLFYSYLKSLDSLKKCFIYAFIFSVGFNLAGFYWISHTLREFGDLPYILSILISVLFSIIILPQHTFGVIIYFFFKKKVDLSKFSVELQVLLIAIYLTLLEQFVPQQFPAHIGHGWLAHKSMLGLTPIFGACMYSFISYWCSLTIVSFITKRKHYLSIGLISLLILLTFIPLGLKKKVDNQLNIRILQANIGNYLKLKSENGDMDSVDKVLSYYRKIGTAPYLKEKSLDLIIMPETAYPFSMDTEQIKNKMAVAPMLFQDITNTMNASLLTGGYDANRTEERGSINGEFNSAILFDQFSHLSQRYHKRVLIPFGETLPFGPLNKFIAPYIKNISFFGTGTQYSTFDVKGKHFITPICYEILLSSFIRDYLNASKHKVNYIINLTNDSWYGDTAEPWQHKFLAHWRAIEFQIPVIRSTNTGLTSVLYPDGSESKRLGIGEMGSLELTVNSNQLNNSTYQSFGMLMIWILWILLALLISFAKPFIEKFMKSNKS